MTLYFLTVVKENALSDSLVGALLFTGCIVLQASSFLGLESVIAHEICNCEEGKRKTSS